VTRDGAVVAVWLFGVSATHGPGQEDLERAGSTQFANGGWSLVDQNGTIYSSWRPELIGRQFTDPANLSALRDDEARVLTAPGVVQVITPMIEEGKSRSGAVYFTFEVPADEFYGDLRVGQQARDLSLLLLVLVTVAGLAFVNHRREQAVRRSEERLDSLLHNAHDVVVVLDDAGRAKFVSSAIQRLLGYTADERAGQSLADLAHNDDRDRLCALVAEARAHRSATATDLRVRDARGAYHWYDIDAVDRTDDKHIGGVLLTCHDVTDRKNLQDQLAHRARHDALTGLANRATLTARLERLTAEGASNPFAILFVDLDHFKPVNDTLGHDAGDEVLRTIADRFKRQVRTGATDMDGDLVCRLGGDEFAIVIDDATELIAHQTAERLLVAAREPVAVGERVVQVSATIGVSLSHPSRGSADQALREADMAMYQAKEAGRDTIRPTGPRS
jgi:diguanylate cyclase (GGDEF)-like protein/PAS domain S-box-containing protein